MKIMICAVIVITLVGCNGKTNNTGRNDSDSAGRTMDTVSKKSDEKQVDPLLAVDSYSNARFKEVTVEKVGDHAFAIEGKAQVFEAAFGWVVEDGHYELKEGYQMTDAGAPEWGDFEFTIEVQKERPNSTLTLVLFESSAKDGSRQHELPIPLE